LPKWYNCKFFPWQLHSTNFVVLTPFAHSTQLIEQNTPVSNVSPCLQWS
jgi:hypothetical protein